MIRWHNFGCDFAPRFAYPLRVSRLVSAMVVWNNRSDLEHKMLQGGKHFPVI